MDALTKLLVENEIDTVTYLFVTTNSSPQVSLVKAAEASQYTRRLIPSVWAISFRKRLSNPNPWKRDLIIWSRTNDERYS